jgi:hypothetical protein
MIKTILPPEQIMTGAPYFFLKDLKDSGSYKQLSKDARGTQVEVEPQHIEQYLNIRNAQITANPNIQISGEPTTHVLWPTIETLISMCRSSINQSTKIETQYLFIEADAAILDDIVPTGIRNEDGTAVFRDWTVAGDSPQPWATSIDETRVVLRCHLGGAIVNMDELETWINYASTSDKNITLLFNYELQTLLSSAAYNPEAV